MLSNLRTDPNPTRWKALIERQVPSKLESYLADLASEMIGRAA
jgi:hypothetical protein